MSTAKKTFVWMGALSVVTLLLGVLREFVIARDLQTSGAADLFFRGLVVVGASRNFGLALFRARWIPIGPQVTARQLLMRERGTIAAIIAVAIVGLAGLLAGPDWHDPAAWVFIVAVVLAVIGGAVRALAERAGMEREGFMLEWALPLGTIAGGLLVGRGAFGPALGITAGTALGLAALAPRVFGRGAPESTGSGRDDTAATLTRWLLVDTLIYVNLGLLESVVSKFVFSEGGFALLNYAYLFVNAALAVPTAAATVVSLRIASDGGVDAQRRLRGWAAVAGIGIGAAVLAVWAGLGLGPVQRAVDAAAGWAFCDAIRPVVLYAVPFAGLRLANTVGRQYLVAHDPRRLIGWDLGGFVLRAVALTVGALYIDILASPLALAVAELVQLGAWVRIGGGRGGDQSDTRA